MDTGEKDGTEVINIEEPVGKIGSLEIGNTNTKQKPRGRPRGRPKGSGKTSKTETVSKRSGKHFNPTEALNLGKVWVMVSSIEISSGESMWNDIGRICRERYGMNRTADSLRCKWIQVCLLYTSPSPRDLSTSRMPSSA